MTLPFVGRVWQWTAPAGDRLGRLRKVLSNAQLLYSKEDPEGSLSHIAPREAPLDIPALSNQKLEFPFTATESIAVLAPGFAIPKSGQRLEASDVVALREFRPQGMVVRFEDAIRIASLKERLTLDHAIVILTSLVSPKLSDQDREGLWRAFEVPVFEYLQSWDGTVIARECAVHDGLHVAEDAAIAHFAEGELVITQINRLNPPVVRARTGLIGELVTEHCECGLETPRLFELRRMESIAAEPDLLVASVDRLVVIA